MLNLGAYRPLPQNIYCYHKLFLQLFLHLTRLPILLLAIQLPTMNTCNNYSRTRVCQTFIKNVHYSTTVNTKVVKVHYSHVQDHSFDTVTDWLKMRKCMCLKGEFPCRFSAVGQLLFCLSSTWRIQHWGSITIICCCLEKNTVFDFWSQLLWILTDFQYSFIDRFLGKFSE